jgi:hypothetical protein
MGHHHGHIFAVQVGALLFGMLIPLSVLALLAGAWFERHMRPRRSGAPRAQGALLAHLATLPGD